jgi:hypothetical protein
MKHLLTAKTTSVSCKFKTSSIEKSKLYSIITATSWMANMRSKLMSVSNHLNWMYSWKVWRISSTNSWRASKLISIAQMRKNWIASVRS